MSGYSGMVVQDPSKNPKQESIFERVRRSVLGAQESELPAAAQSNRFFSGSSRTPTGETRQQQPEQGATPIVHNVHFWRNGFTVGQGPLRLLDDPTNLPFLEARDFGVFFVT